MKTNEFIKKYYLKQRSSNSIKWSTYKKDNCLPLWIADMDFKNDEKVINALKDFIEFGDYGYANLPNDYYDVLIKWHKQRNDVTYKSDWIRFSKGAVDAMYQVIYAFTKQKDAIMINTPLYPPFAATIKKCNRKIVDSPLINNDGYFTFNYQDIEEKIIKNKVKMFMLCSPHNPIGRVYKKGELEELFDICKKHKVLVCSDEVHSDIIMPDQKYIPSLALKQYQDIIISIVAASKSFSLAIFSHSHIIIPNEKLRKKLISYQQDNHLGSVNVINALPTYYNYLYATDWLDSLNNVVFENYKYIHIKLNKYFEMSNLEGSYLLFLNLGKYNKEYSASEYLMKNCHIKVNPGESFGKKYHNWVRINLATSKTNIEKVVRELLKLVD